MPKYKTPGDGIKKWQKAKKDAKLAANRTKKDIRRLKSERLSARGADRKWYDDEIRRLEGIVRDFTRGKG